MTSELITFNHLRCHSSSTALRTRTGCWKPTRRGTDETPLSFHGVDTNKKKKDLWIVICLWPNFLGFISMKIGLINAKDMDESQPSYMIVKLFHNMSFLSKKLILAFLLKHIKKQIPWLYFPLNTHIWLTYILLPTTFYSSTHFAPRNTLPFNTVCSPEHSAPWNTLMNLQVLRQLFEIFFNLQKR